MMFATNCTEDLIAKLRTITSLEKKTLTVYGMDDLLESVSQAVKPAVGVLYEGARVKSQDGGKQVGVSGEAVFSLMLVVETSVISKRVETKSVAHDLLDQMRGVIQGTRSPTGHFWQWAVEAPATQKGNLTVWVQRWTTPVQLPPVSR